MAFTSRDLEMGDNQREGAESTREWLLAAASMSTKFPIQPPVQSSHHHHQHCTTNSSETGWCKNTTTGHYLDGFKSYNTRALEQQTTQPYMIASQTITMSVQKKSKSGQMEVSALVIVLPLGSLLYGGFSSAQIR